MKRCQLSDLVIPVNTWNPGKSDPEESFQYIDLSAVDQETKSIVGARNVGCSDAPSRARQLVKAGDILVSTVRPNLNGVAKVPDGLNGATASTGFCVVRPKPELLDGSYLFHWVKSDEFIGEMVKEATGASYPAVSDRIVLASRIPLSPLPEQRRIAAILDQADALRAKRRETLALLDELQRGIFIEMFGDPLNNPKNWPVQTLENFFSFRTGKLDSNAAVAKGEYPFFTCAKEDLWIDTYAFDCEALLLAGNNASADYSVKHFKGRFNAYQRTYVITLKSKENSYKYSAFFLEHHLAELKRMSKGSSTKYLTLGLLNKISIPIPPQSMQRKFEQQIEMIEHEKGVHLASQRELDSLFVSLQHRAFRGEL